MKKLKLKRPKPDWGSGYSYVYRKRRTKADWSGMSLGDAFKSNLDYYARLQAQRRFYQSVRKAQATVAGLAVVAEAPGEFKVKPQLSPCYTTYPATLAAHAAIGLTAFLEFEARVDQRILSLNLRDYLKNPAKQDGVDVQPEIYAKLAELVTGYVQNRLLLTELSRTPALASVELYRLFATSQHALGFETLGEILRTVIYYGDVLPDWGKMELHPLTRSILQDLSRVCSPFFSQLHEATYSGFINLGGAWVRAVCACLAKYLPRPEERTARLAGPAEPEKSGNGKRPAESSSPEQDAIQQEGTSEIAETDEIAPLNEPKPPSIFKLGDAALQVINSLLKDVLLDHLQTESDSDESGKENPAQQTLEKFAEAIEAAGGQDEKWEDIRYDLVERAMRQEAFEANQLQGNPVEGHEVNVQLGKENHETGEIFDRPVELSGDLLAHERLLEEAAPITESLRRNLYPNVQQISVTQRLRSSGSLDPARLALADFSGTIFKRHRIVELPDRRGRPLLVLACDGSGSLDSDQMKMLKVLAAGWLESTARGDIQILAGLYHSGQVREGLTAPLVQWIHHPRKSPTISRREATLAVVSLPDSGTGVQSDALSLAYIMEEARALARRNMTYLILLTDTRWNQSFNTDENGAQEVYSFFEKTYESYPGKLHTTLVALGVERQTGFEDLLDKVITVSEAELEDYTAVAKKIGVYVASCMRERELR